MFSVKSCYRRLVGEQSCPKAKFWKRLWSLELPAKVTNFVWRVCRAVVPTAVALVEKKVQMDIRCSWCLLSSEDIGHVLFGCSFARDVWIKLGIPEVNSESCQGSVNKVLSYLFNTCSREKLTWIAMIC